MLSKDLHSLHPDPLRQQVVKLLVPTTDSMRDPESFFSEGGPFLTTFFLFYRWGDPNTTISGPSSVRQWNAITMAFRWCTNDGPTWNAGLVALWLFRGSGPVSLRNLWFCNFSGGMVRTSCPPLDPRMHSVIILIWYWLWRQISAGLRPSK